MQTPEFEQHRVQVKHMNFTEGYAYLNWKMNQLDRAHNYAAMAEGYQIGALRMIDSLLKDNLGHDADAVIFPILFCAHQSLELYLKATKIAIAETKGKDSRDVEVKPNHKLDGLVSSLNAWIDATEERLVRNKSTCALFGLIDLLKAVGADDNGGYYPDFARFPESPKQDPYVFVKDDSLVYKLGAIRELIESGCGFLDGYYAMWVERADPLRNARSEAHTVELRLGQDD